MIRLLLEQPALGESGQILVRSKLRAVAQRMGFSEGQRGHMELVCMEMLSNQVKYARGSGLFQIWESTLCGAALDMFALDYGPGIPDLAGALADGYTTAGTMGRGLGAIERLADQSGVYSVVEGNGGWSGVAVWARFYRMRAACPCGYESGGFLRAYGDAPANGDCVCTRCVGTRLRWLHLDGLGHGNDAAAAVAGAEVHLDDASSPEQVLGRIDRFMAGRRGAVGLVAELDFAAGEVALAGVGDVTAALLTPGERQVVPFSPGVLGHSAGRVSSISLTLGPDAHLLTASDGLRRGWSEQTFPGLWRYHPQMIAFVLGNLMGRSNDDKSIFIVRQRAG